MLHSNPFERYAFVFYRYSDECGLLYSNTDLIDSLVLYREVYAFHQFLQPDTKHYFIGNRAEIVTELIKKHFENNGPEMFRSFIQYASENKPKSDFYCFLSTVFFISIANRHDVIDGKKRLMELRIFPTLCLRSGPVKAQKIEIASMDPVAVSKITEIICTKKITGIYIVTEHKNRHKRVLEIMKTVLANNFIDVSDYRIIGPSEQRIDFDLRSKNLFIIFEDNQKFFERISYKNNFGILIKNIPIQ